MPDLFRIGKNCKFAVSPTATTEGLTEMKCIDSISINSEKDSTRIAVRGRRVAGHLHGSTELTVSGSFTWNDSDAGLAILVNAFDTGTPVYIVAVNGDATVFSGITGTRQVIGSFLVQSLSEEEPDEAVTNSFNLEVNANADEPTWGPITEQTVALFQNLGNNGNNASQTA